MAHDVCHQHTCVLKKKSGHGSGRPNKRRELQQKAKQRTIAVDLVLGGLSRPGVEYTNLKPLVPHPVIGQPERSIGTK
jgi:hypothetical protein